MTSSPVRRVSPGPALTPVDDLRAWLAARGDRLVRLPIALTWRAGHRIWIGTAHVAASASAIGDSALAVEIDDSRLGVGIIDHLRHVCPDGEAGAVLWIDGLWHDPGNGRTPLLVARAVIDAEGEALDVRAYAVDGA